MARRYDTLPLDGPKPALKAPKGTVDTHIHFFDGQYPGAPGGPPPMADCTPDDYRRVQARLGLDQLVVVQPNAYQFDNRCSLDALRAFGKDARAILCLHGTETDAELQALHDEGVRGARIMDLPGGASKLDRTLDLAARIAPLGWHVITQFDGRGLKEHAKILDRIEGDYVIDHTAKYLEPVSTDDPAFHELLRLVDKGNCFVKLSALYETSKSGPPFYEDVGVLARALIEHAPDRMIWATNWPHNGRTAENYPDDANQLDCLSQWTDSAAVIQKILVDNPRKLYDFAD